MFGKKKEKNRNEKQKNDSLNFKSENYQMKDRYNTDNLVVGNLEYISSEPTLYGPMVKSTEQKYIFEVINDDGKIRYREIFTGFIADDNESGYFDLPYAVNIAPLKEVVSSVADTIPKYGLLLVLNEVNTKNKTKKLKK